MGVGRVCQDDDKDDDNDDDGEGEVMADCWMRENGVWLVMKRRSAVEFV